jgi:hypothetical protein
MRGGGRNVAEPKTRPTKASVSAFLRAIDDPVRRKDCEALVDLMRAVTKSEPRLWGPSIVGFGSYQYAHGSPGGPREWPLTGFSPRKQRLTLYVMDGVEAHADVMARLGTYTTGKSCVYVKRLADLDLALLKRLVAESVRRMKTLFPAA